ncbi:MAG: hypothetical protein ABH845_03420, partial [Candidatus Omnitrophota bacterium]
WADTAEAGAGDVRDTGVSSACVIETTVTPGDGSENEASVKEADISSGVNSGVSGFCAQL